MLSRTKDGLRVPFSRGIQHSVAILRRRLVDEGIDPNVLKKITGFIQDSKWNHSANIFCQQMTADVGEDDFVKAFKHDARSNVRDVKLEAYMNNKLCN